MNYLHGNYMSPARRTTAAALIASLLAGCALPGPKDAPLVLARPAANDLAAAPQGKWPAADWWKQFDDPQLTELVAHALADSPSIAIAQARIRQANAVSREVAASRGVDLSAGGSTSRQLLSANSIYPPPYGGNYFTITDLELDFSYDFDFWGRTRSALQATFGERAAAQAEAAGAAAALSAAVAKTYFAWQALGAQITLIEQLQGGRERLAAIEGRRVRAGLSPGDNVHPLRADLAGSDQTLIQLRNQRDQVLFQLKSLVGGDRNLPVLEARPLPDVAGGLPPGLSLDLVARRADVAAARDRVQASVSNVDSARAAFYPDISFTAFAGLSSFYLGRVLESGSEILGATPALHLPIFDAGRLKANLEGNRADVQLAIAQYDQAVQTAVAEINDAALRMQGSESERPALAQQIQARTREMDNAERFARAGLADERQAVRDRIGLVALEQAELVRHTQALLAQIDLTKALGGGFQDPPAAGAH
jgi:outer membrane protein, multidrug efflux system